MREGKHILFDGRRGRLFLTSMFMHRFSKFKVIKWLELEYICILAVIDNRISHMGQFELKSFFAGGGFFLMERKNG